MHNETMVAHVRTDGEQPKHGDVYAKYRWETATRVRGRTNGQQPRDATYGWAPKVCVCNRLSHTWGVRWDAASHGDNACHVQMLGMATRVRGRTDGQQTRGAMYGWAPKPCACNVRMVARVRCKMGSRKLQRRVYLYLYKFLPLLSVQGQ